jgi:UDP-N-acetylglucosamine diphosphorylase / glucose-1-phosphate thymidylyltransferase / UDP-N-acetylgalactosamine diphosphorylase / glucosamine-1-phosphate N-acetyltransferase / galactosamine-1-phosphate N-acetyltransferase
MQAVILAAGKGKRMGKLTQYAHKNMLKIKGKTLLEYKIEALPKKIKEIVFVVGYYAEDIMNHFGKEFNGRKITYVFQPILNGTGGALHVAKSVLQDKFLVMMGDDLYHKKDIAVMLKYNLAVLAKEVDDPSKFGVLKKDKKGHLVDIIEKPKNSRENLANAGIYMLNKNFFDYDLVPIGGGEFGLPQTMIQMRDKHRIKVQKATVWYPISSENDLMEAEKVIHKFV